MADRVYTDLHFFSGIGGTALGTAKARAVFGDHGATFRALGGVELDAQACRDFERLTGAPALCVDVHELQSLRDPSGAPLVLDGTSHTRWRMAIGNAVPPDAAQAVAEQLLLALLRSDLGAFALSTTGVWVAPHAEARVA